jgi:hypothetical protein
LTKEIWSLHDVSAPDRIQPGFLQHRREHPKQCVEKTLVKSLQTVLKGYVPQLTSKQGALHLGVEADHSLAEGQMAISTISLRPSAMANSTTSKIDLSKM